MNVLLIRLLLLDFGGATSADGHAACSSDMQRCVAGLSAAPTVSSDSQRSNSRFDDHIC
jgi:hypothetical protein